MGVGVELVVLVETVMVGAKNDDGSGGEVVVPQTKNSEGNTSNTIINTTATNILHPSPRHLHFWLCSRL